MGSPYSNVIGSITGELQKSINALGYPDSGLANSIAQSKAQGDVSCSIAFRISNSLKKAPNEIASAIASKIGRINYVSKISSDSGFINFYLDRQAFSKDMIGYLVKTPSAAAAPDNGKKIIIEYVSVNPVHPWHVGHLRNALIGDAISNIYEACGYSVERQDYMDNLGLQATEAVWGTMNIDILGVEQGKERRLDYSIGEIYVAVNKLLEKKPELIAEIKKVLALMEQDGTYESKLARDMAEGFLKAERETAFSYGIYQDVVIWESDIVGERLLEKMLEILERKCITKKPTEGKYKDCIIIEIADLKNLPKELTGLKEDAKVLVRSDGSANYLGKDIAFHMWKLGMIGNTFKYSKFMDQPNGKPLYTTGPEGRAMQFGNANGAITITDTKQSFEQLLIKVIFDSIGESKKASELKHIGYGVVDLEAGKLSGRKGTWIGYTADDLFREAKDRAKALIKTSDEISEGARETIAEKVGLAAIKFEFLKISPERNIIFSWERALNFEGSSGPYCQYMYARASRILEKSGAREFGAGLEGTAAFEDESTFGLIKLMSSYQGIIEKACREERPNVVTDYLTELAVAFSKFYESVPILTDKSEKERAAKLSIVFTFRQVMRAALSLIGVEVSERM
jgi:arginyl-tRNA synthetase